MEAWSFGKLLRSPAKPPSDLAPADPDPHFSASWHRACARLSAQVFTPHTSALHPRALARPQSSPEWL